MGRVMGPDRTIGGPRVEHAPPSVKLCHGSRRIRPPQGLAGTARSRSATAPSMAKPSAPGRDAGPWLATALASPHRLRGASTSLTTRGADHPRHRLEQPQGNRKAPTRGPRARRLGTEDSSLDGKSHPRRHRQSHSKRPLDPARSGPRQKGGSPGLRRLDRELEALRWPPARCSEPAPRPSSRIPVPPALRHASAPLCGACLIAAAR